MDIWKLCRKHSCVEKLGVRVSLFYLQFDKRVSRIKFGSHASRWGGGGELLRKRSKKWIFFFNSPYTQKIELITKPFTNVSSYIWEHVESYCQKCLKTFELTLKTLVWITCRRQRQESRKILIVTGLEQSKIIRCKNMKQRAFWTDLLVSFLILILYLLISVNYSKTRLSKKQLGHFR